MMPPLLIRMHVVNSDGRTFRLWIPLLFVWLLLLPVALFVLPVLFVVCLVFDIDPVEAVMTIAGLLAGLSGTHIEIDTPNSSVFFHIV